MVKADAYGVGVVPVVRALERLDPWGYGVATVEEGAELRAAGIARPIIVFTPALASQFASLRAHALRPVLDHPDHIREWNGPFHLEIDTGMGRAGIPWHETERIASIAALKPEGVFTHFHSADESEESVREQEARFDEVVRALPVRPALIHRANSAGCFRSGVQGDLVRPGIFLYGGSAGRHAPPPAPVVSVSSRVVSLRSVRKGDTVSYGAAWRADRAGVVATLGIGYADGVRRAVQGRAEVLIGGRRYPVVGRITMDMTMVDLGPGAAGVQIGDRVVAIGSEGGESITVDDVGGWAGTISYEILTGLGRRVPRVYSGGA